MTRFRGRAPFHETQTFSDEVPFSDVMVFDDGVPFADGAGPAPGDGPEGPRAGSRRSGRGRALAGLLVLVLVAAVLVVLSRVAAQRIPGSAVADWPAPPAVGSCVNLLSGVGGVAVVPCDGPHDAEVTKAYSALDPVLADAPSDSIDAACADAAWAYLGAGAAGVDLPDGSESAADQILALGLNFVASAAGAPAAERAGDLGWMVCDIQPAQAVRYSGSVRGATADDAPDAYRWCWSETDRRTPVSCTEPHVAELLGIAPGYTMADPVRVAVPAVDGSAVDGFGARTSSDAGGGTEIGDETARRYSQAIRSAMRTQLDARRESLGRLCVARVADAVGAADPTYGGVLRTMPVDVDGTRLTVSAAPGDPAAGAATELTILATFSAMYCLVSAPDGHRLTHSLIDWGDRPPPLTAG